MPSLPVSPSCFEAGFGYRNPGRGGEPNTCAETLSTPTSLFIPKPHRTALQNGEEQETRARKSSNPFLPLPPKTLSGNLSPSYAIKRWEIGQSRLGSYFQRPLKLFLVAEEAILRSPPAGQTMEGLLSRTLRPVFYRVDYKLPELLRWHHRRFPAGFEPGSLSSILHSAERPRLSIPGGGKPSSWIFVDFSHQAAL